MLLGVLLNSPYLWNPGISTFNLFDVCISPVPRVWTPPHQPFSETKWGGSKLVVFKDYGAGGQNDVFFSGAPPARPEIFDIFGPKITDFPLRNSHFSEIFRAPAARPGFSLMTSYKPTDAHRWRCLVFSVYLKSLNRGGPSWWGGPSQWNSTVVFEKNFI